MGNERGVSENEEWFIFARGNDTRAYVCRWKTKFIIL
jgi:hypothetical protein